MRGWLRAAAAALAALAAGAAAQVPDSARRPLDTLYVQVGRLGSGEIPLARAPYAVQVVGLATAAAPGVDAVPAALRGAVGVTLADQFGSEAQPDLRMRGFQAGPVVGFPQSVSVFVDGVRVNEPDASQVNFDLIPLVALQRAEVIRGPGGPFGRNALAGAVNLVTRRAPAAGAAGMLEASAGSFGARQTQGWAGAALGGGAGLLVAGRYHRSDGWRDLSATEVRQLYAKAGVRRGGTDAWLSYTWADNRVEGPGSLPRSWLRGELPDELSGTRDPRRLQYTGFEGDWFRPRLHFGTLGLAHGLGERLRLSGVAFVRANRFTQANDNITEPNVRGETDLLGAGGVAQLAYAARGGGSWSAGVEYTRSDTDILIFEAPNAVHPDAGGLTEDVGSREEAAGAFAQGWWPLSPRASVTASVRFDYVALPVTDRLDPENSGRNHFRRLTGSLGGETALSGAVRLFGGYGRGFRAPVILEVTCADPEDPCPLPFELGADPPLKPVTADTWQAGLRYAAGGAAAELVAFWAEVHDDLFSVMAPASTRGYFTNLDRTRRQGVELAGEARLAPGVEVRAGVALVRATFQSEALLTSALIPDDDDVEPGEESGGVRVRPGNRFAMVPALAASAGLAVARGRWRLTLEGSFVGSQYFLGDEANEAEFGRLPAYFVLDGGAERAVGGVSVFVHGRNLLDARHHTFGMLSPNTRGPHPGPEPFLTPGMPLRVAAGVRWAPALRPAVAAREHRIAAGLPPAVRPSR